MRFQQNQGWSYLPEPLVLLPLVEDVVELVVELVLPLLTRFVSER
jgi:hypothetical protein